MGIIYNKGKKVIKAQNGIRSLYEYDDMGNDMVAYKDSSGYDVIRGPGSSARILADITKPIYDTGNMPYGWYDPNMYSVYRDLRTDHVNIRSSKGTSYAEPEFLDRQRKLADEGLPIEPYSDAFYTDNIAIADVARGLYNANAGELPEKVKFAPTPIDIPEEYVIPEDDYGIDEDTMGKEVVIKVPGDGEKESKKDTPVNIENVPDPDDEVAKAKEKVKIEERKKKVKNLQKLLVKDGLLDYEGDEKTFDGIIGKKTLAAIERVKAIQKILEVKQDGIIGTKTRQAAEEKGITIDDLVKRLRGAERGPVVAATPAVLDTSGGYFIDNGNAIRKDTFTSAARKAREFNASRAYKKGGIFY